MGFIALIGNLFGAVKAVFGFQSKRLDLKNSLQMQEAVEAQREAAAQDQTRKAIAGKDVDELRKELAE